MVDAVNIKSLDRDIKDCVAYITITKDGKGISGTCYQRNRVLTGVRQEDELKKLSDGQQS